VPNGLGQGSISLKELFGLLQVIVAKRLIDSQYIEKGCKRVVYLSNEFLRPIMVLTYQS